MRYLSLRSMLIAMLLIGSLGGVYELKGNELRMLNPGNDGTRHYVWKIEDKESLLLVEAPTVGEVGSDYRGAALTR
jgi:hypothetical protein